MQCCLIERDSSALVSPDVLIEYCIRFTDFLVYLLYATILYSSKFCQYGAKLKEKK